MKSAYDVEIVGRHPLGFNHVELIVQSPELRDCQPGQFVHILTPGMLRRPISFSRIDRDQNQVGLVVQIVGSGTQWLYDRTVGDTLNVMGPLGRGFTPPQTGRPWALVGGGVGIPPLHAALQTWRGVNGDEVTVILGARSKDVLIMADDFRKLGVDPGITTDDGSLGHQGVVTAPLAQWITRHPTGQVMACGPTGMLQHVHRLSERLHGPTQLALEQRMGCGIGACLACVVPAQPLDRNGPRYRRVCTDGPVFEREELVFAWT